MNVRKTQLSETRVRDKSYTLTQFDALKGIKYLKKIQKLLVPVWAELVNSEGKITPEVITLASEKFYEMDENDIKMMICDALCLNPNNFETEFAGEYIAMFNLLKEIIMFNFQDVFTQLGLEEI